MDAWASPWADDTHQGQDPGHRRTVSTLQDFELFGDDPGAAPEHTRVDSSLEFTSKLDGDGSDFEGATIWARDLNELGGVDSSSAWASDSTSLPLPGNHSNVYQNWEDNVLFSGESQIPGKINIGDASIFSEGTSLSSQDRPSTSITTSTKEFSDGWTHKLQPDWSSTVEEEDQTTAEAVSTTILDAHQEKSGDCELQSDSPSVTGIVITEEQLLASTFPQEKTVPTSSFDQSPGKRFVQGEDSKDTAGIVPHNSLFGSFESIKVVEAKKPENGLNFENNQCGITPEAQEDDDFGDFGDAEEGEIEDVKFEMELETAPVAAPITHPLTPLDFTIDSSLVFKLYPSMQKSPAPPPVEDIISTTSTRKAWYRISRVGTVGKHNSGDGDDYVRVTWSKSKVRADVCDIVNRWVKEGRFSVSDAIGEGRSYGAIFGWGDGANTTSKDSGQKGNRSSAPTVLGLAGYKCGTKSTHKASISISSWDPLAPGKSDISSVADFGWGSPKESKPETAATKNTTSPKKEQTLPSVLLSTSSNSISPETPVALKDLAVSTIMKAEPQAPKASMEPGQPPPKLKSIEKEAPKREPNNWEDSEATPIVEPATVPEVVHSGRANHNLVSGQDTWASLELFEKGTLSHTSHTSPPTSLDSGLRNLGLYFSEKQKKKQTMALEFGSAVEDDDWGEMINSPATPVNPPPPLPITTTTSTTTIKNRRPSTAHGQTNPSWAFQVGVPGATNFTPIRRDSAPTFVSPIYTSPTVTGAVPTTENNSATVVDWDFSVFEGLAKTDLIPASSAVSQVSGSTLFGGSQALSNEDKVAMDILEGLPDMCYMLR